MRPRSERGKLLARIRAKTRRWRGHLLWTGAQSHKGWSGEARYPIMRFRGTVTTVMRVMHWLKVGPVPAGYDVHHTCSYTLCVAHFQAAPGVAHRHGRRWSEPC